MIIRTGIGYDVHQLVEGRKLWLGGVEIAHSKGLDGHSDADVLIHAIADAILGAIGKGDIGVHFPNTDNTWKNAPSCIFLEKISSLLREEGWVLQNIDASLIAEAPKLLPHVPAMKSAMGKALGIDSDLINLKATTNEKMGFVGREEGIAALATACLTKS
jgi:2-C-methyl-D-erythritol 2,4-cyclodiphosphate synthase